jgi:hypothetical protein
MKYIRWYDKNPDLREVFDFIETLNEQYQIKIAHDILQILMNNFNLDLDKEINEITNNYKFSCKRWYDKNIDLFTCFEIIKGLSDELQEKVIRKIIQTALLIYLEDEKNG